MNKTHHSGFYILIALLYLIPNVLDGQVQANLPNSVLAKQHYSEYFKSDPRLVSGDFYQTPLMSKSTGDPFFIDANWKKGSVTIDGVKFDDIQLRYDITSHQLILNSIDFTDSYIQIVLKKDLISEFTLGNKLFLPYPELDPVYGRLFAEAMVQGDIDFLVVKTKSLKVTAGGASDYLYQSNAKRYLRVGAVLIAYRGKRTLKKEFPQHKQALNEYIKENKLRFKRLNIDEHAKLISFCNQLIQGRV